MGKIVGCVCFSAETAKNVEEDRLGRKITKWMEDNPFAQLEGREVVQSDNYISVLFLYSGQAGAINPLDI